MNVGIGLPSAVPGTEPGVLIEWAQRADAGIFSSLGVVDRLRYYSFEPMTTLTMAAAVTSRIGLVTMVVIAPLRNGAVLAKQAATLNTLSKGRFTLGVALGARSDDYEVAGIPERRSGAVLDSHLGELRSQWDEEASAPGLIVGGMNDVTFLRIARFADGYVHGGGPPRLFERAANRARTAWAELGRTGSPALWAQGYFALGDDDLVGRGRDYMRDYYSFTGPFAERIAEGMLATPQAIAQFVRGYAEAGCDELVLLPAVGEIEQLDRLQDVLMGA